ncbi:helix-turn-helix domain-containing protein [Neorhizobium sp. NPDC001467]|uniref:helix-turn-helix domain-containing protein n=1 Tax=Neorhizobium sp. NPDC001467 TaxID=3390595 RepID=UPI003D032D13
MRRKNEVNVERGRRIRQALAMCGHSKVTGIAAELGISPAAFSKWLQGHAMGVDHACELAHTLGVSLDWLLAGDPQAEASRPLSKLERNLLDLLQHRSPEITVLMTKIASAIPKQGKGKNPL